MKKLTYKQAYDKIIQAYFRDEIKPFDSKFCFCGTLNNNNKSWTRPSTNPTGYLPIELMKLEAALYSGFTPLGLEIIPNNPDNYCINSCPGWQGMEDHFQFEDALFAGMSAALDVLKEIHRERGEDVDGVEVFTKHTLGKPIV